MNLRILPIVLTVVGSSAILFGGWFAYHSVAMESPLNQIMTDVSGVESSAAKLTGNKVVFDLKLGSQASLREIVHEIDKESAAVASGREVVINLDSQTSPELEAWWSRALFDVAQAMETSQYSKIPDSLKHQAGELEGLDVHYEMDDKNVYIRLTQGENAKFIILPRTAAKMGVWPSE